MFHGNSIMQSEEDSKNVFISHFLMQMQEQVFSESEEVKQKIT
jgi:hypothetical protein